MTSPAETRLIEALERVDRDGDVGPADAHDPMTMALRHRALQSDLIRWDDDRARYVLTGTGRGRIAARGRAQASIVPFRRRDAGLTGKPTSATPGDPTSGPDSGSSRRTRSS